MSFSGGISPIQSYDLGMGCFDHQSYEKSGRVERILWNDPFLPGDPKSKLQKGWVSSLDGDSDNIQILGNTTKIPHQLLWK